MKRNESVLVYAVTGLLLVILLVAVVFGEQSTMAKEGDSAMLPANVRPVDLDEPATNEAPAVGDDVAGTAESKLSRGEAAKKTETVETPPPAKEVVSPVAPGQKGRTGNTEPVSLRVTPPVTAEQTLKMTFGTSRREGNYRVVKPRRGATLAAIVAKWCGGNDRLAEAQTVNEAHVTAPFEGDQEALVPWVEASEVLAAKQVRDAEQRSAEYKKGRRYSVKKGDSLWIIAKSQGIASRLIPAWLEKFKQLNPQMGDLGALVEGQKIRLPR